MATPTYPVQLDTRALLIAVGDGQATETFANPVLINTSRSFSQKASINATVVPRTDDPTQPGQTVRIVTALDSEISGDGIMDAATALVYYNKVGTAGNIKVQVGSATGNLVVTGSYFLEEFTVTGQKQGDLVTVHVKFVQASAPTSSAHV
jgi:hypothetical protein